MKGDGEKRALRIVHIGKYFPPHRGGMETYLRDLMVEQQRQGLNVSALVHASERGLRSVSEVCEEQGQSLHVARAARWLTLAFAPIAPTFPLMLRRCLREERPDILHVHMPNLSAFWCLFLPAARRVVWVVHWHADVLASTRSVALRWLYWLYRPFERALLRRSARVIATSPPYLASSEPLENFRQKCEVVPLGIADLSGSGAEAADGTVFDHPHVDPGDLPSVADPAVSRLRVLCIGRLTYYKGVRYLVKALASVDDVSLAIVGSGDEEAALEALIRRLGLANRVRLLGTLPDEALQVELDRCDCLCLPSVERTEAFGIVLLEAMRAGKAVVATTVPGAGMRWVVEDGSTGLLVEPESALALAGALATLRDDEAPRATMGAAGRRRFERHFRINQTTETLSAVYRSVIADN